MKKLLKIIDTILLDELFYYDENEYKDLLPLSLFNAFCEYITSDKDLLKMVVNVLKDSYLKKILILFQRTI